MANLDFNSSGGETGLSQLATNGNNLNKQMGVLITTLQGIFPRVFGTFTLAAAATTTVSQPEITASSIVVWIPTNAASATLLGSGGNLYLSALTAGASFTVATASGAAAAGTETLSYFVINPV